MRLVQRLYSQQEGTVLTDKESDAFPIKRGTKPGDPLSSLLFNTVLQFSMEGDLKRWQEKQKGIRLSDKTEDCLTNLRFADDVLLFSTSLEKLREMLCEFKASTEAVGLGIHPDKTKILSNQDKVKAKEITVDNIKIEVLAKGDSARYLGQKITPNTVLQISCEGDLKRWQEKQRGIRLSDKTEDCLTNLRFADDVLVVLALS